MGSALLKFESARALKAGLSLVSLAAFVVTLPLIVWLMSRTQQHDSVALEYVGFLLGLLWSWVNTVSVADRNRGSALADIWWALEPSFMRQSVAIFLAWAPLAFVQGAIVLLVLAVVRQGGALDIALLFYLAGFALGVPGGVMLTTLSRLWSGASLIVGLGLLVVLAFAEPIIAGAIGNVSGFLLLASIAYAFVCGAAQLLLSPYVAGRN